METKLKYYGGNGFETCHVNGEYKICLGDDEFTGSNFKELKEKYDLYLGEKYFWDETVVPELIDGYFFAEEDCNNDLPFSLK